MKLPRRGFLNIAGTAAAFVAGRRVANAQTTSSKSKGRSAITVTPQLCERIVATDYGDLGAPAIAAARRLMLDGLAIAIAGTEEEAIQILAAHHKEQGGSAQATAIANGFRLNTVSAAALNGAAMHVLDFEPMAEWGAINAKDLALIQRADTPSDAFELLRAHLVTHHLEPSTEQEAAAPGIAKTRG